MTLGIMQPYFLPYLGYWQLLNKVDKYIVLDDVTFIKQGYINRNAILCQGKPQSINILVNGVSSNKLICNHELNSQPKWKNKLLNTIFQNYSKAPFFKDVYPIIERCILYDNLNLSYYLLFQLQEISKYMGVETGIVLSSTLNMAKNLTSQERIIEICKIQSATTYINAIGGQQLYDKEKFKNNGVELKFMKMKEFNYIQFSHEFVPFLSIIDVLMFNSKEKINNLLLEFNFVK